MLKPRLLDPEHDVSDAPTPRRTIVIASSPRSGSTMLADAMIGTGVLGVPDEYCDEATEPAYRERFGTVGLEDTLAALIERRTTPNGVFANKLHCHHALRFESFRRLSELHPGAVFVHLTRQDLTAQAISFVRGYQTRRWTSEASADARSESPRARRSAV